jgi:hypothetical protein
MHPRDDIPASGHRCNSKIWSCINFDVTNHASRQRGQFYRAKMSMLIRTVQIVLRAAHIALTQTH